MEHRNPLQYLDPMDGRVVPLGRFDATDDVRRLWWSGSGLRLRLSCRALEAEVDVPDSEFTPWLAVTADGALIARFPLMPGKHRYAILEGMDPTVAHEIEITRDTQPCDTDAGPMAVTALFTDGELLEPWPRARLLEFIGDSLTVGEGLAGRRDAMEWRMAWISNAHAFPSLTTAALDADKRVLALGGWGVWRSWEGNPENRMGRIYGMLCGVVPGGDAPWDFSAQRQPDAVIINLGTNDAGALKLLPEAERPAAMEEITGRAVELIRAVRAAAPDAQILWAYGLCGNALEAPLRRAVALCGEAGDARVRYVPLTDCGDDLGSREHPGRHAHAIAAQQILSALAEG